MRLTHDSAQYEVGSLVAEAATYRLYLCEEVSGGQQHLLQIATDRQHNGGLDRAAFILRNFKTAADLFEVANAKKRPEYKLNFDRLFPLLVDSFICDEQNRRQVNILSLKDVDAISSMVPLSNLSASGRRVDLRTSIWIMGRLLKLLNFSHSQGVAIQLLSANNVLIGPDRHFVVVLDWAAAHTFQAEVSQSSRRKDIVSAAQTVFTALGGNPATGVYPYDCEESDQQYLECLRRLMFGREVDAETAHRAFYERVNDLYGISFHPFHTLPL